MDCACCYISLMMSNMSPWEKEFLVKGICKRWRRIAIFSYAFAPFFKKSCTFLDSSKSIFYLAQTLDSKEYEAVFVVS